MSTLATQRDRLERLDTVLRHMRLLSNIIAERLDDIQSAGTSGKLLQASMVESTAESALDLHAMIFEFGEEADQLLRRCLEGEYASSSAPSPTTEH